MDSLAHTRTSLAALVLVSALSFCPTILLAQEDKCHEHPPSISLQLGTPDDWGRTTFKATFTFAHDPYYYNQRVDLWVNGRLADQKWWAPKSGTWEGVLELGCSFPPAETITVIATEGGGCPDASDTKTVAIDSTPSGSITATGPDVDGNVRFKIHYAFPYTPNSYYSARSVNFEILDPDGKSFATENFYWRDPSGTIDVGPYSVSCRKKGAWTATALINGCVNVPTSASFTVDSTPIVGVQVFETGSTHQANVQYEFPQTPYYAIGRHLRLHAYDANGVMRVDRFEYAQTRDGTWSVPLDTSCWPDGPARVEALAACPPAEDVASQTQVFEVRNQPKVSVSVADHPTNGPTATVMWDFPRAPGNVRVAMIVPPSGAETQIASFTPDTLTGSRDFSFDPPIDARTVTIQARASGTAGCHYDVDSVPYDCTCREAGDPVDLADGNMRYSDADPLPGGAAFAFSRVYDSRHQQISHFGEGWTSALDARITVNQLYSVILVTENNEPYTFVRRGTLGAVFEQRWPRSASPGRLVHDLAAATYTFTPGGGGRAWIYSAGTGRLIELRDLSTGRAVRFAYDAAGRPTTVSDSWEAWAWTIITDATTHLVTSISVDGRSDLVWTYQYDADKRLIGVLAPGALTWRTYAYTGGRMTEAYDASGNLIESHTYDANGWAISSKGPSGEITSIEYALAGSAPGETITRLTFASGATTEYRMRVAGGTQRPVQVDGGCASCGGGAEGVTAYDAFGLPLRQQDARGYVTSYTYDPKTRRLLTRKTHQQPYGCDPEADPNRCRLTPEALGDVEVGFAATSATVASRYAYGDPNWPELPTTVSTESTLSVLAKPHRRIETHSTESDQHTRRETLTYDPVSGEVLSRSTSGWTGEPLRFETRVMETMTFYNGTEVAAFNPGGSFDAAWMSLAQPRQRKSIDGPRTDVQDQTVFVYYPVHSSVPAISRGRLAAVRNAAGHITRFERYDVFGNAERVVDPNGVATEFAFDALGRPHTTTIKGITGCDTSADPLCATDVTTTSVYAGAGALESQIRAGGGVAIYTYDTRRRIETISRGPSASDLRERMEYGYDPNHGKKNLERLLARDGTTWVEKRRQSFSYNTHGELQTITHADGKAIHYAYDAAHQVESVRDENHLQPNTRFRYDPAGRLLRVTQTLATAPEGEIVTSYGYDAYGNLTGVGDPNGNITSYLFDDFGLMHTQLSPVTGTTNYTYDLAGQLVSMTDANGATTSRTYDAMGRPLAATFARAGLSSETISWTYDDATSGRFAIGRLASMTDAAGTTTYSYERRGLLREERRQFTATPTIYTTSFAYDRDGNRSKITYPSGQLSVTYGFDFAGRPVSASDVVTAASYLPFGPLRTLQFANGTTQTMEYDARYLLRSNELTKDDLPPAAGRITAYNYLNDGAGNVTDIQDAIESGYDRHFVYDDLNRLITTTSGTSLWVRGDYAWDAMGNIVRAKLTEVVDGEPEMMLLTNPKKFKPTDKPKKKRNSTQSTVQPLGRDMAFFYRDSTPVLQAVSLNGLSRSVNHDAAGNQTSYVVHRRYSARNLFAEVHDDAEPGLPVHKIAYSYDGRGLRVARAESPSDGEGTTARRFYIYTPELQLLTATRDDGPNVWGGNPPSAYANNVDYEIVWFAGRPVAQIAAGGSRVYTFTDHLGTPILQTDQSKIVRWRVEHEPFGNVYEVREGTRTDQPLRFPGQELAMTWEGPEESYNIFRWYNSSWGRYTSTDPIGLQGGLNLYDYAVGNPIGATDPMGLSVAGAARQLRDLVRWPLGLNDGEIYNDGPVVQDLRRTPMWRDILRQFRASGCNTDATYCANFDYPSGPLRTGLNAGQMVGSFCARFTKIRDNQVLVRAWNDWGLESGTRLSTSEEGRSNPSIEAMLRTGTFAWPPKSAFEDRGSGPFRTIRNRYRWIENVCCD